MSKNGFYGNFSVYRNAKGESCAHYFGAWDKAEHNAAKAKAKRLGVKIFYGYPFENPNGGTWINGVEHYFGGDGKYHPIKAK